MSGDRGYLFAGRVPGNQSVCDLKALATKAKLDSLYLLLLRADQARTEI